MGFKVPRLGEGGGGGGGEGVVDLVYYKKKQKNSETYGVSRDNYFCFIQ